MHTYTLHTFSLFDQLTFCKELNRIHGKGNYLRPTRIAKLRDDEAFILRHYAGAYLVPATPYSLLTPHYSFAYSSLLTPHLLAIRYSVLTTHCSLLITNYFLLTTHYSPLTTHYSLLTP